MTEFKLNNTTTFAVEDQQDKWRLIILTNEHELACRKVTKKALAEFLKEENASIFKGRLQLHKFGKELLVTVSGTKIGSMPSRNLYF